MKIIIDSREKKPLPFEPCGFVTEVVTSGLPFADYWAEWEPEDNMDDDNREMPVVFERKTIGDLYGTLSGGMERFKVELQKALDHKVKFILIVDGLLTDVLAGNEHSTVDGSTILKTMFTLWVKYDVTPVFCDGPLEMMRFMLETWSAIGRNYKRKRTRRVKTS